MQLLNKITKCVGAYKILQKFTLIIKYSLNRCFLFIIEDLIFLLKKLIQRKILF